MRKWSEKEALDCLMECGAEKINGKTIIQRGGWNGLKACSAMDYLSRLNYKFKMINSNKPKKPKNAGDAVAGVCVFVPQSLCYNNIKVTAY